MNDIQRLIKKYDLITLNIGMDCGDWTAHYGWWEHSCHGGVYPECYDCFIIELERRIKFSFENNK